MLEGLQSSRFHNDIFENTFGEILEFRDWRSCGTHGHEETSQESASILEQRFWLQQWNRELGIKGH
jgi:hypothetical protein